MDNVNLFRLVSPVCSMTCALDESGVLRIEGKLSKPVARDWTLYAANPIQRLTSYSGSALPYPNREAAMEGTPNWLNIPRGSSEFKAVFWYPNAFASTDHTGLVPPALFLKTDVYEYRHDLPNPFPLRTLTYRDRDGPEFYMRRQELGVRSQEQLIRELSEPNPYLY